MKYRFKCECGHRETYSRSIHDGPGRHLCRSCGLHMERDWLADLPQIDTSGCRDHDDIPPGKRVARSTSPRSAVKEEALFQRHIEDRRKVLRDGGNRGSFRHTHSVPADLYHGKIRETGDKNYWSDPANLRKHNTCKVDE